ncbi:MAG: CMGC/CDK protein kinase [Amphiamblys sp. WSBS2006]|nr:MAG: CMGC/CDK protein kinase [Amphiamblys sp. WSBS2006]
MRKGLVASMLSVFPFLGDGDNDGVPLCKAEDYEILEELGCGISATVHKIRNKETGEIYALKMVDGFLDARKEIDALRRLGHENVVEMIAKNCGVSSNPFHIVLEHLPCDLESAFESREHGPRIRKNKREILRQVLEGIAHVHSKEIEHKDIYPKNILVDPETMAVKICDFGNCVHNPSERNNDILRLSSLYRGILYS